MVRRAEFRIVGWSECPNIAMSGYLRFGISDVMKCVSWHVRKF
jgi:hypothetical protein